MNDKLFKENLEKKADKINIKLTEKQLNLLVEYKKLILEWNTKINLTAIVEDKEFIDKHFIDSLTIEKYIQNEKQRIIDIGTGAGFPGIPLKILKENNEIVLFDALNKRLKVLDEVINSLELKKITTLHGRAEETFRGNQHREMYDIAVSRAVASLCVLSEYMLPAVKVGGICICMKSNDIQEELDDAKKAIKVLGGAIEKVESIVLPETEIKRNIIVIKKVKQTPKVYPRKAGTPSKNPIK